MLSKSRKLFLILAISFPIFSLAQDYSPYVELQPSIYNLPIYRGGKSCGREQSFLVRNFSGGVLSSLCASEYYNCSNQGSCVIYRETDYTIVNKQQVGLKEIDHSICRFSITSSGACADPYFSVARDYRSRFLSAGDVIYVPSVKGLRLPTGQIHDGFFIVRDTGTLLMRSEMQVQKDAKGRPIRYFGNITNRLDFFIGTDRLEPGNPFKELGLADKTPGDLRPRKGLKSLVFSKVLNPRLKEEILRRRNFPFLPR